MRKWLRVQTLEGKTRLILVDQIMQVVSAEEGCVLFTQEDGKVFISATLTAVENALNSAAVIDGAVFTPKTGRKDA